MEYDRYTSAIRADFEAFANALRANYLSARAGSAITPHAVHDFRLTSLAAVVRFMQSATLKTSDYVGLNGDGAVSARFDAYLDALRALAVSNANDLSVRLMAGSNDRLANLLNRPAGALGQILQNRAAQVELTARDRSGRTWQSDKLVATMAREFAYNLFIDAQIQQIDTAMMQVVMLDPNHRHHGMLVSKGDLAGDLRKTIFHPNSSAQLRAYVPT